jgi:FlgD Ig-like domain
LQRLFAPVLVLGLLAATAAAFAITENLKLTKSPILRTHVAKRLSPTCNCVTRAANIDFQLRNPDVLTLTIVNSRRNEVARLVDGVVTDAGEHGFVWHGRTPAGSLPRDGAYYVRVHLQNAHRTILLPNRIDVDSTPPRVVEASASRQTFSPDGDGKAESIVIHYKLSEPAHALLFAHGERVVRTRFAPRSGSFRWSGRVRGTPLPQGTYGLRVGAEDLAGNVTGSRRGRRVLVHIRYIALARSELRVQAGFRFGIGVDTDASQYTWRLGSGESGSSSQPLLVTRAPNAPGRYRLVVSENGHRATASVVVLPRR